MGGFAQVPKETRTSVFYYVLLSLQFFERLSGKQTDQMSKSRAFLGE